MAALFSFFSTAVHISMVIGGVLAVVALFSAKKPRASNREIKIAVVMVLGVLIIVAIIIAVVVKYD